MSSKNRLLKIQFQLRHSGLVKVRKLSLANDVKNLSEIKGLIRNLLDADLQDDFDLEYLDGEEKVMIGSDQELQLLWQNSFPDKLFVAPRLHLPGPLRRSFEGESHQGTLCFGCHDVIRGFRYKCVVCPHYDICGKCETAGLHPAHDMLRISTHRNFPPHFFSRLHRLYERILHSPSATVLRSISAAPGFEFMAKDFVDEEADVEEEDLIKESKKLSMGDEGDDGDEKQSATIDASSCDGDKDEESKKENSKIDSIQDLQEEIDKLLAPLTPDAENGDSPSSSTFKRERRNSEDSGEAPAKFACKRVLKEEEIADVDKRLFSEDVKDPLIEEISSQSEEAIIASSVTEAAVNELKCPIGEGLPPHSAKNEAEKEITERNDKKADNIIKFMIEEEEDSAHKKPEAEKKESILEGEVRVLALEKEEEKRTLSLNTNVLMQNSVGTETKLIFREKENIGSIEERGKKEKVPETEKYEEKGKSCSSWRERLDYPPKEMSSYSTCEDPFERIELRRVLTRAGIDATFLGGKMNSSGKKSIAEARDAMLAMGFTDEDGWLTQLITMKRGDIDQVLEVLDPVKTKAER